MCPIVPMFTCGFDRSNFSLPMTLSSPRVGRRMHRGSGEYFKRKLNLLVSVVRVQLEKLLSQLRHNPLQASKIQLGNLPLIGVAEPAVLCCCRLSMNPLAKN